MAPGVEGAVAQVWEFGQSDYTNFLKVWSGMVENSFRRTTVTDGIFETRRISHGKSVQWPLIGIGRAVYHTKGEDVLQELTTTSGGSSTYLSNPWAGEKLILIDNPLVASEFVADFDEFLSHYSIQAATMRVLGEALAIEVDLNRLMVLCNGAAASAIAGAEGTPATKGSWSDAGQVRIDSGTGFLDTVATIRASFKAIAQGMDERDIPRDGRYAFVKPQTHVTVADDNTLTSADWRETGGDLGRGRILNVHGFDIIPTNRLADLNGYSTTYSSAGKTGQRGNDYTLNDYARVDGIFCHRSAMASVELNTTNLFFERKNTRLGGVFLAHKTMGNGWIRQSAIGAVVDSSITT